MMERKCVACGVDADALRAETIQLRRVLQTVDRAFDQNVVMAWDTRLAARQKALIDVKAALVGGIK